MNLHFKILSGFLVLSLMLITAGLLSIYEFNQVSHSVKVLLDENYKSITAARNMTEALEREDSGILLLMSGDWENGRRTIKAADHDFHAALAMVKANVTIDGEQVMVDQIDKKYAAYRSLWERPIVDTRRQGNMNWYFSEIHPAFLEAKAAVDSVMTINEKTMYNTASGLRDRAGRAIMPGIVAIISALIFTVVFNFFINLYVIRPIRNLNTAVRTYLKTGVTFSFQMESRDEIFRLTESIRDLIASNLNRDRTGGA